MHTFIGQWIFDYPWTSFLALATVMFVVGFGLARSAESVADRGHLSHGWVGGLFLAGATSLPELSTDLNAVFMGLPDLAVGDLIGSCAANILLLAIFALVFPKSGLLSAGGTGLARLGWMGTLLCGLAGLVILLSPWLGPLQLRAVPFLLGLLFLAFQVRSGAGQKMSGDWGEALAPALAFLSLGAGLVFLAPYFVRSADAVAKASGLEGSFVGAYLVGLATSLPELASTWTALRRGAVSLAAGNLLGSNAFNIFLLFPLEAASASPILGSVSGSLATTAFYAAAMTGLAAFWQARAPRRAWAAAVLLLLIYLLSLLTSLRG